LTEEEEEEAINDEDEIIDDIREEQSRAKKIPDAPRASKPSQPFEEDDEMFFSS